MTEFRSEIRERIAQTRRDLADAREAGDDYLVDIRLGELDSLARVAAEHGVEVPGVEESTLIVDLREVEVVRQHSE
jgi:hypothetical protein